MSEIIDFTAIQKQSIAKRGSEMTIIGGNSKDDFGYSPIMDKALRIVVKEIIEKVKQTGLPGKHHLYISFYTDNKNVIISKSLLAAYPKQMTICLQHQFSNVVTTEDDFTIVLSFNGVDEKLTISYDSIISLIDPSVPFGIGIMDNGDV